MRTNVQRCTLFVHELDVPGNRSDWRMAELSALSRWPDESQRATRQGSDRQACPSGHWPRNWDAWYAHRKGVASKHLAGWTSSIITDDANELRQRGQACFSNLDMHSRISKAAEGLDWRNFLVRSETLRQPKIWLSNHDFDITRIGGSQIG